MDTSIIKSVPGVGEVEFSSSDIRFDINEKPYCEFAEWDENKYTFEQNKFIELYYEKNKKQICSELAIKYAKEYSE